MADHTGKDERFDVVIIGAGPNGMGTAAYLGGLVLGGRGYLGAGRVADDLGVERWWRPTKEMDRYIKTYLQE